MKIKVIYFCLVFCSYVSFSQSNKTLDSIDLHLKANNLKKVKTLSKKVLAGSSYNVNDKFQAKIALTRVLFREKKIDSSFAYLNSLKKNLDGLNPYNKSVVYAYYGHLYRRTNLFDSAIFYYNKSLKLYDSDHKKYSKDSQIIYKSLALLYKQISNKEQYYFYLEKALEFALNNKDNYTIAQSYNNVGVYYEEENNYTKSLNYYKKALHFVHKDWFKGLILQNIGSAYVELKKIDSAKFYFNNALKITNDKLTLSKIYFNLSKIALEEDNKNQQKTNLLKALEFTKNENTLDVEDELIIYKALYDMYLNSKKYDKAIHFNNLYHTVNDSLKKIELLKNINELETKYETEKKKKKIYC